jgi:hypothetical protein
LCYFSLKQTVHSTLAAEVNFALFDYHKMLMEFGLPGGDHSCAALMNLELIRIIEVTCERLRVSHASLSGAKDVSAISMNTRQAAELRSQDEERVKAAERSWRDVKDAAYQELYPCGELRGGLGDEDENRIEYMRRWLGRRRAVSMNHTDPLATVSRSEREGGTPSRAA